MIPSINLSMKSLFLEKVVPLALIPGYLVALGGQRFDSLKGNNEIPIKILLKHTEKGSN